MWLTCGLALLLSVWGAVGQGTFQNLNFEAANVPDVPAFEFGTDVLVSDGVPGWVVYTYGGEPGLMFHNNISTGGCRGRDLRPPVVLLSNPRGALHRLASALNRWATQYGGDWTNGPSPPDRGID